MYTFNKNKSEERKRQRQDANEYGERHEDDKAQQENRCQRSLFS